MIYPKAEQRPCSNQSNVMSEHLGLILHVQVGNNDLGAEFNNPNSQASYTWVALKSGHLIQFCDANAHAWAQARGNDTYNSVGTQGFPNEPLTEPCCMAIADLYVWGHDNYGWPYKLADLPGQPGFGWHGMGGNDWGGHPHCPGDIRKNQRQHILDLALGANDMTDEERKMLQDIHDVLFKNQTDPTIAGAGLSWDLTQTLSNTRNIADKLGVPRT